MAHPLAQPTKFDKIPLQPPDLPIQEKVAPVHQTDHNGGADDAGTRRLHHLVNGAVALVQEALAEKHRAGVDDERFLVPIIFFVSTFWSWCKCVALEKVDTEGVKKLYLCESVGVPPERRA